jgi:hypothetical protein
MRSAVPVRARRKTEHSAARYTFFEKPASSVSLAASKLVTHTFSMLYSACTGEIE